MVNLELEPFLSKLMLSKYLADAYTDSVKLEWWVNRNKLQLHRRGMVGSWMMYEALN